MGIFDGIFNNDVQQTAANDQITGLNNAYTDASGAINTTQTNTNADYAAGLVPYTTNLAQVQPGMTAYGNALGVNGPQGNAQAVQDFQTSPGYEFALDQANQNIMRNASATGGVGGVMSGGTLNALNTQAVGQANQQWQQYIQNLQPYIGASTANAAGAAGVNTSKAGTDTTLGTTLANLAWSKDTGIGNANANATLAQAGANSNILNAGMGLVSGLMGFL